jgi:phage RecT family recombinase
MSKLKKLDASALANKSTNQLVQLVQDVYVKNELSPELELQFIQFRINEDFRLQKAAKDNPASLYSAILQAAESGLSLNPQWQEGYLVPYRQKVNGKDIDVITFSPMYRGKKKLLISKGIVRNITTELVYKGEKFEENIVNGEHEINHKPDSFNRENQENIIGGYAIITHNNGEIQTLVKGRDYFERCKKASEQKMGGKTSPAWKMWYDQMAHKCLINAADSVIPKIGISKTDTEILNSLNEHDIDYVDVTDEKELPEKPQKQAISSDEFKKLVHDLNHYAISLKSAAQKYKGYEFTPEQKKQIKEAGTITDEKISEIVELIKSGKRQLNDFAMILTSEQMELVDNAAHI